MRNFRCFHSSRFCLILLIWLVKIQVVLSVNNYVQHFKHLLNEDSLLRSTLNLEYQYLYTTHGTEFKGGSLSLGCINKDLFIFGLGVEFSHSGFHNDNGWKLYNLNFVPVFVDFKLNLRKNSIVVPFLHTSEGISFNSYKKIRDNNIGKFYHVSENGFYVYAGTGISIRLCKYLNPIVEVGFKGYHMSFNNLHINPHGFTIRAGMSFNY
jgi:hypothetical protein